MPLPRLAVAASFLSLLALAQPVRGQSNLALHKPASQSSTILPGSEASVCVDGNRTSGWCHTKNEPNPWWQVDLGGSYALTQIVVYNRADGYGARERTIGALISSDGESWTRVYTHDQSNFEVLRINVGNQRARYVRLQLAAADYMNLLEVEVYGTGAAPPAPPPTATPPSVPTAGTQGQSNLALHKPASQSSTILPGSEASVCVDGNRTSGWCHTKNEPNPWWQVDLGGSYALTQIVVYNRADGYGARERTIGALISSDGESWTRVYTHDQSNFEVLRINVGNQRARYVRLQLAAADYMNLLEVEVYGAGAGQPSPPSPTGPPPAPAPATGGVRYRVENFVYNAPDLYQNPRNYHDFMVDFASCTVRELNRETEQGLQTIRVLVCRDRSRLTFTARGPNTMVEYDWVFLDDGKSIAGAYRQGSTFGPSVGGRYQPK